VVPLSLFHKSTLKYKSDKELAQEAAKEVILLLKPTRQVPSYSDVCDTLIMRDQGSHAYRQLYFAFPGHRRSTGDHATKICHHLGSRHSHKFVREFFHLDLNFVLYYLLDLSCAI
jgi:hypothetical protein